MWNEALFDDNKMMCSVEKIRALKSRNKNKMVKKGTHSHLRRNFGSSTFDLWGFIFLCLYYFKCFFDVFILLFLTVFIF